MSSGRTASEKRAIEKATDIRKQLNTLKSVSSARNASQELEDFFLNLDYDISGIRDDAKRKEPAPLALYKFCDELLTFIADQKIIISIQLKKMSDANNQRDFDNDHELNTHVIAKHGQFDFEPDLSALREGITLRLEQLEVNFPEIEPAKSAPTKVEPTVAFANVNDTVGTIRLFLKNDQLAIKFSNVAMYNAFLSKAIPNDFMEDPSQNTILLSNATLESGIGADMNNPQFTNTIKVVFNNYVNATLFNETLLGGNQSNISAENHRTTYGTYTTYEVDYDVVINPNSPGSIAIENPTIGLEIPVTQALNEATKQMNGYQPTSSAQIATKLQQPISSSPAAKPQHTSPQISVKPQPAAVIVPQQAIATTTQLSTPSIATGPTASVIVQNSSSNNQTATAPQPNDDIRLYRAKNMELAINFNSKELRDAVLHKICKKFGKGAYVGTIDGNDDAIYFKQTAKKGYQKAYLINFPNVGYAREAQNLLFSTRTDIAMLCNNQLSIEIQDPDNVLAIHNGKNIVIPMSGALNDVLVQFIQDGKPAAPSKSECSMM